MDPKDELDLILNDAGLADWWREEAARQDALGAALAAAGRTCPMPSREDAEAMYPPDAGDGTGEAPAG